MSSSAQLSTGDDVYLGVWTNWSHGKIREATLTVSRRNGGLLTAFLALLVGVAGTSFWRIGCFFIHRYFSSKVAADALYHQKQAILRNSSNSQSGLLTLLQTCWAWRRNTTASFWRFLPSICFAIITLTSFAIAGIFSSAVATSMGQKVLLKSPNCGTWNLDGYDQEQLSLWQPSITKGMVSSLAYAQRCYRKDVNPRDCAIFIQPRLEWKTDHNATCPFVDKNICLSDSGNLRLDNGYINSDHHLGINNPPGTSFLIRTVVDCAPLQTKGYTKNTRVADRITTEFFYGEPDYSLWNSTYEYSARIPGMDLNDEVAGTGNNKEAPTELYYDYSLRTFGYYADVDGTPIKELSDFTPIPALWPNTSDISLFFLSANDITFFKACDDPWYAATTIVSEPDDANVTFYHPDHPARGLACASQYQFCNADFKSDRSCTPFAGFNSAAMLYKTDEHSNLFNASLYNILTRVSDLNVIVSVAGIASLKSRDTLSTGLQGSLPNNQWQLEVENWYGATLADLQRFTVEYATGPIDPALLPILQRPQTESERQLCHSVKIRSDAVTSYSILGLSILLGSCGLLIIVSMAIESFTGWVGKKCGKGNYQQLEWMSNNTLQLQRFAHEELGCGTWVGEDIPITAAGETLAVLDISEPDHPRLVNPASSHASVALANASSPLMADASSPIADTYSPTADASVATANASLPLVDASPLLADASLPTANAFVATVNPSPPLMDASPPLANPSSPIADASSPMINVSPLLMNASLFLADPPSPLADTSSPTVDVSPPFMEETSSSISASFSRESSTAPIIDT